jgi:hypothetical protein
VAEQQAAELGRPGEWVQLAAVDRETAELCGDCAVRIEDAQRASAEIDERNAAVHRLLERLGLRCEKRIPDAE